MKSSGGLTLILGLILTHLSNTDRVYANLVIKMSGIGKIFGFFYIWQLHYERGQFVTTFNRWE